MCLWRTGSDHRMDGGDGGGGSDCRGHPEEKRRPFSSFGPVRLRDALPRRIQLLASRNRVCDMAEQTPISEPCCCKRCPLCSPSCCHLSLCLYHCSVPAENYLNYSLTHVLSGQRLSQVVQLTVRSPVLLVQSVPMELTDGPAAAGSLTVPRESALDRKKEILASALAPYAYRL